LSKTEDLYRQNIGKLVKYSYINEFGEVQAQQSKLWLLQSVVKVEEIYCYDAVGVGATIDRKMDCSWLLKKIGMGKIREMFIWEFV
jgi:hypothetical protein